MIAWLAAVAGATCLTAGHDPVPLGGDVLPAPCGQVDVVAAGRLFATVPESGVSRGVAFPYALAGLGIGIPGDVSARVAVRALPSGGSAGYVGVAGEAWVPVVQNAEARWDWPDAGLAIAGGMVDDPWVVGAQRAWGLPTVAGAPGEEQGWMERSDVGGWAGWTAPEDLLTATATLHSGEGWLRRERNQGVDLSLWVALRPLQARDRLEVALYGREGSRGLLSARDHRAGLLVSGGPDLARVGAAALIGLGALGDGALTPLALSAFGRTGDAVPLLIWARADHSRALIDDAATAETALRVGAGPRLPLRAGRPLAHLVLGLDARLLGADATPVAGATPGQTTVGGFVELAADLSGHWALQEGP